MKKFDVFGIGNALVDYEFEVSPEHLKKLGIEKGIMTLIDEEKQNTLLEHFHIHDGKKASGGSAANTLIAISQFGGKTFYTCRVANDEWGDFYCEDLKRAGVESNITLTERPDGHTGKCIVLVTPDADRTMNTHLGITAGLSINDVVEEPIRNSKYVYIEGYLVTNENAKHAAIHTKSIAEAAQVKTSLSFSDPAMPMYFRTGLLEILGKNGVDLLFCNEDEAKAFAETNDLSVAINVLKNHAKTFAVTRGKFGSLVYDGSREINVPPHSIHALDSTGAGDMYAGAFLHSITNGDSYEQAGRLASLASARIVGQFGPRLEEPDARAILHEFT